MTRKKQDKNRNIILLISVVSIIILIILGAIIYSWGKSNGYEKRDLELEQGKLNLEREASRLSLWEDDLSQREMSLNQTIFNITDYQNKKRDLQQCQEKLDEPSKFDFIIPLYYSHTEIQWIIISITLIFPISLVLSQIVIKDKGLKIVINWFLLIILLIILIALGVE